MPKQNGLCCIIEVSTPLPLALAVSRRNCFNPFVEILPSAWQKLLDGRFVSGQPGRTLWNLFSDQRGRVASAVAFYVIKQTPASLLPLAVGLIQDALTHGGEHDGKLVSA